MSGLFLSREIALQNLSFWVPHQQNQKMESKTALHLVSHLWRSIIALHQSPFHQLLNHLCNSLFFITPPQQPNSMNVTRTTTQQTTQQTTPTKQEEHKDNNYETNNKNTPPQ